MTSGSLYCEIQAYPSIHSMMFLSFVSFYVQQYTHPKVCKEVGCDAMKKVSRNLCATFITCRIDEHHFSSNQTQLFRRLKVDFKMSSFLFLLYKNILRLHLWIIDVFKIHTQLYAVHILLQLSRRLFLSATQNFVSSVTLNWYPGILSMHVITKYLCVLQELAKILQVHVIMDHKQLFGCWLVFFSCTQTTLISIFGVPTRWNVQIFTHT